MKFSSLYKGMALTALLSSYAWSAQEVAPCSSHALEQIQAYALQCEATITKSGDKSNCLISAENIFKFFNSQDKPWERSAKLEPIQSPDEYVGTLTKKTFENLITGTKPSQDLLYINLFGSHAFIVEKIPTLSADGWRVYQSSQSLFTLSQWLSKEKLQVLCANNNQSAQQYRNLHKNYGHGQLLTTQELVGFFAELSNIFNGVAHNTSYVGVFKITNTPPRLSAPATSSTSSLTQSFSTLMSTIDLAVTQSSSLSQETNCDNIARNIIYVLNGTNILKAPDIAQLSKEIAQHPHEVAVGNSVQGTLTYHKDVGPFSQQHFFNNVLSQPTYPEHTLFYITVFGEGLEKLIPARGSLSYQIHTMTTYHSCIIEKCYDGTSVWWRIHHSWENQFTLPEWLGLSPWKNEFFSICFQELGNGKKCNKHDVLNFFNTLCKKKNLPYRAERYQVLSRSSLEQRLTPHIGATTSGVSWKKAGLIGAGAIATAIAAKPLLTWLMKKYK